MARLIYTLALVLLLPYVGLHLLWRGRRQPEYLKHAGERFGFYPDAPPQPVIWLHAVSVGETRAAQPLVAALLMRYPDHRILLTHMTPTGRETSEQLLGERVMRVYLPYDYPWAVRRFLGRFRPRIGVILETEIWPNLVAACHDEHIPLLLVNARLSEKSARRYARFTGLTREALGQLAAIAAQTEADAARLRSLGAPRVEVFGNVKFDILPPREQLARGQELRAMIGSRQVVLAASTREGEEELILDALAKRPLPGSLLVIVPRHPQRFEEVAALIAAKGFAVGRRSQMDVGGGLPATPRRKSPWGIAAAEIAGKPAPTQPPATEVLLGDSMGEMFAYYAACDLAFVGGSLLDYGGQNLIEACAVGAPVLIGRSTFNFTAVAEQAIACGAVRQVGDAEELLSVAAELLHDKAMRARMGEAGTAFATRHRGATQRTMSLIERHL